MNPTVRSNEEWQQALSRSPPDEAALIDLRRTLKASLSKALGASWGVDEADLEDFAQESLLRVLDKRGQFRGQSRFSTWASSVAIRVALTQLRRRRAPTLDWESLPGLTPVAEGLAPVDEMEQRELIRALGEAVETRLTKTQRQVIRALLEGLPLVAVADRLGKTTNAIYKIYFDSRKRLRRALEESGYKLEERHE